MRMALALLDRVDERCAALHLQHALDVATDQPPLQPGEEIDPDLIERILGPNRLHYVGFQAPSGKPSCPVADGRERLASAR